MLQFEFSNGILKIAYPSVNIRLDVLEETDLLAVLTHYYL